MTHRDAITKYIGMGFKLFPVHYIRDDGGCSCRKSACASPGKHPMVENGVKEATSDSMQIAEWCATFGEFNIGISTDGMCVVDIDMHGDVNGVDGLKSLQAQLGVLPATLSCDTGGGGRHGYYFLPKGVSVTNRVFKDELGHQIGVDIRGNGGYVIAPPSNHESGNFYVWRDENARMSELPKKWIDFINTKQRKAPLSLPEKITKGGRNDTLYKLACSLRSKGVLPEAILESVRATNVKMCVPPLTDSDVGIIVNSACTQPAGTPRTEKGEINIDLLTMDTIISQDVADYISGLKDDTARSQEVMKLLAKASELKVRKSVEGWIKKYTKVKPSVEVKQGFKMKLDLDMGGWAVNNGGVFRVSEFGVLECCCPQPIQITRRLINIETENEKVELSFYKDGRWRSCVVDKIVIADKKNIVQLVAKGIGITSETAKLLVIYLFELESMNQDKIPVSYSISRLGWTNKGDFSPYNAELEFDGEPNYRPMYEAIGAKGDLDTWVQMMNGCMFNSPVMRLVLAGCLASPLMDILHAQIFFVHLWGGTGVGKTVALHAAMSIWGDSRELVRNWNSTSVGLERLASFLNNIPLVLDEFQIVKSEKYGKADNSIYMLSMGMGKSRGNKFGGMDAIPRWNLTVLTNGEHPLTEDNSNGGAKNRAVELYCSDKIFQDPGAVMDTIREHYGHAGRKYIDTLSKIDKAAVIQLYKRIGRFVQTLNKFTDKQVNAVSVLLTADTLYQVLFNGAMTADAEQQALQFLTDNLSMFNGALDIEPGTNEYEDIIGWVASNRTKFEEGALERYGELREDRVCIIGRCLHEFLEKSGYNYNATLKTLANGGYIEKGSEKNVRPIRIDGVVTKCIVLMLNKGENANFRDLLGDPIYDENFS